MLNRQLHTCRISCIYVLWMYHKSLGNLLNFINNVEKLKIHHRILPQDILPGAQNEYVNTIAKTTKKKKPRNKIISQFTE